MAKRSSITYARSRCEAASGELGRLMMPPLSISRSCRAAVDSMPIISTAVEGPSGRRGRLS